MKTKRRSFLCVTVTLAEIALGFLSLSSFSFAAAAETTAAITVAQTAAAAEFNR